MEFLTPLLVISGFGAVLFVLSKRTNQQGSQEEVNALNQQIALLKSNLEKQSERVGELEQQLKAERSEKDEQAGKSKQLWAQGEQMKADVQRLGAERDDLRARLTKFEAERERREQEQNEKLAKLEAAENALKQERARVIKEDEERLAQERDAWDRMWNDHEISVISGLSTLCKDPAYAFKTYDNTNLPDDFDGSLKPDFMVEFLDQYVIFDAKVSKSESLQTYINNTVKSTATKLKKSPKIYPHIFFVVPTQAISELKKTTYALDGYTFYVVVPEAVPVVLQSLKRIATYELAEQLDPQERENIVNLIAELDFHINFRNAADLFLSKLGTSVLNRTENLNPEIKEEIELKKREMKSPFNVAEIKKLMLSTTLQDQEIREMVSPKAAVQKMHIEMVKEEVVQQLL